MQEIGTHYSALCPLLLNDNNGAVTSSVTSQHHHNPDAINQDILIRWLQGQGKQPVTWFTLICVLRDVELSELARGIEEDLVAQMQSKMKAMEEENDELHQQLEIYKQQLHTARQKVQLYGHITYVCI